MKFIPPRDVSQFCRDVDTVAGKADRSAALQMILQLVNFTTSSATSITRVLSSRQLDAKCLQLGRTSLSIDTFDPDQSVFLVTFLARSGGHTRVLRDLISADPGKRATVLVSNVMHDADADELRAALGDVGADIHVASADTKLEEVVIWIQEWLVKLRAERIYMLQHCFDPVIPASVQPSVVKRLFYIHHCDHSLALGIHIPYATHVDLHGKGFHSCREREGVQGNVCWPLTATPGMTRTAGQFPDKVSRTCTSGGREKFGSAHLMEQTPYLIQYPDMVAVILATTGGTHHHIGGLPTEMIETINRRLEMAGIDPARFIHVEFVPRLSDYFLEKEIDLYVTSMPWGGGRALIEVMATGLPILVHSNYQSVMLTDQCEVYPGAATWRDLDELACGIKQFDRAATLEKHAHASLTCYQAGHRPEMLLEAVGKTLRNETFPEPSRPSYHPDALQTFFDERASLGDRVQVSFEEVQRRNEHLRELEHAFRVAEKFAHERLNEIMRLDKQLILTDQALASVTKLVHERDAEIERLRNQIRQADSARVG